MTKPLPSPLTSRAGLLTGAFFLFTLIAPPVGAAPSPDESGAVVLDGIGHVVDGDTLDVGGTRVRLEGIDAPEIAQTCTKSSGESWNCGRKAAERLRALAEGAGVACDRSGTDKYGRTLAICYVDGSSINETMVREGLAWAFVKYSSEYVAVEALARADKVGVWEGTAEAPWDYRHGEWQVAENTAPKGCAIKGNISNKGHIYHMPWSPWYAKVRIDPAHGERWFCSEAEALAAGWRAASPN